MDYKEAIEILKDFDSQVSAKADGAYQSTIGKMACDIAISAMQELEMYKDNKLCLIPENVYGKQCDELDEYKRLGTLEEVRDAVEKQKAKKPIIQPWSPARCPTCGEELSENLGDGYYRHRTFLERCTNVECAQRLDWSEEND